MPTPFNPVQYADLLSRPKDLYAETKYRILMRWIRGRGPMRVLNVGCGSGEFSFMLADAGHDVHGIDPAAEYVELAVENARARGATRCAFDVRSIEEFDSAEPFDCVAATDVLEHIADDTAALSKMVALTRAGGVMLLTVPAGQWLFGRHDESLGHFRRYSSGTLRQLVEGAVDVKHLRYFGFALIPICLVFSKWMRRPYPVAAAGDSRRHPIVSGALRGLLAIDSAAPMPLGTSVLLMGLKK